MLHVGRDPPGDCFPAVKRGAATSRAMATKQTFKARGSCLKQTYEAIMIAWGVCRGLPNGETAWQRSVMTDMIMGRLNDVVQQFSWPRPVTSLRACSSLLRCRRSARESKTTSLSSQELSRELVNISNAQLECTRLQLECTRFARTQFLMHAICMHAYMHMQDHLISL